MKHLLPFICLLALTACSPAALSTATLAPSRTSLPATATPLPPTASPTPLPPSATPTATATILPPTETVAPLPVELGEQPYLSQAYAFQIAYPTGWTPVELGDVLVLLLDPTAISTNIPTQAVTISSGPLETFLGGMLVGVPLEGSGAVLQALVPQLLGPGIELGELEPSEVGGLPAMGAAFTGQDETGIPVAGYVVLLLTEERAAILLASAPVEQWPVFAPTFSAMLDTFTFTNP